MNARGFLIVLAQVSIVLVIVQVVEEGDPLAEFRVIAILHEELLRDAHRADLVLALHRFNDDDQSLRGVGRESEPDVALRGRAAARVVSQVREHQDVLEVRAEAHVEAEL